MAKYPQWEYDLLRALGAPLPLTNDGLDQQFPNSLLALNLWAQSEGSVTNNALATSGQGAGATTCVAQCGSTSPIYEYDNEADGVAQMARFLQGSFYTKIVSALVGNASLSDIFNAINGSPWCKGCQNGQYPEALAAAVGGKSPGISSNVGTGSTAGGGGGGQGGGASANPASADLSECVISFPGFLFFSGPCILTKGGVKWLSGVAALVAGTAVGAFGVILLASTVFNASGAKAAVGKVAGAVPGPVGKAAKLAGSGGAGAGRRSSSRTVGLGPSATPKAASSPTPTAGRRESRQIENRFRETERQQGPIGPRGGNPTAGRIATRERRGRSVPGAGSRMSEAQRRQARASEPF